MTISHVCNESDFNLTIKIIDKENEGTQVIEFMTLDGFLVVIDKVLSFLSAALSDFTSRTSQNKSLFTELGLVSYQLLSDLLISNWLVACIPKDYKSFKSFNASYGSKCIQFEEKWVDGGILFMMRCKLLGFIAKDQNFLSQYCLNIKDVVLKNWSCDILQTARQILATEKHDYEVIEKKTIYRNGKT
jgi:hypothetical protein